VTSPVRDPRDPRDLGTRAATTVRPATRALSWWTRPQVGVAVALGALGVTGFALVGRLRGQVACSVSQEGVVAR
jgi:hypothetical protein